MPSRTYSSVSAFVAHWRALREDHSRLSPQERQLEGEMEQVIGRLHPRERDALLLDAVRGEEARRRERAEYQLSHLLTAAGWLQS